MIDFKNSIFKKIYYSYSCNLFVWVCVYVRLYLCLCLCDIFGKDYIFLPLSPTWMLVFELKMFPWFVIISPACLIFSSVFYDFSLQFASLLSGYLSDFIMCCLQFLIQITTCRQEGWPHNWQLEGESIAPGEDADRDIILLPGHCRLPPSSFSPDSLRHLVVIRTARHAIPQLISWHANVVTPLAYSSATVAEETKK